MPHMSIDRPDEDDDVRKVLEADNRQTSARHDEAVLLAARSFASEREPRARTWLPRWAAVAAGLAVVGVAVWLVWQVREQGEQTDSTPQLVASVVLSAGTVRGDDEIARVNLPAASGVVRLQLDLATVVEHPTYRAELHTQAGGNAWSAEDLKPRTTEWGKAVFVDLASSLLEPGEYELMLQRATEIGGADDPTYYYFSVQRRE
jgi:hypothetical protein